MDRIPTIDEIDRRRREADLSQRALCLAAGIDPHTYSRIKRGHTRGMVDTLRKLWDALQPPAKKRKAAA